MVESNSNPTTQWLHAIRINQPSSHNYLCFLHCTIDHIKEGHLRWRHLPQSGSLHYHHHLFEATLSSLPSWKARCPGSFEYCNGIYLKKLLKAQRLQGLSITRTHNLNGPWLGLVTKAPSSQCNDSRRLEWGWVPSWKYLFCGFSFAFTLGMEPQESLSMRQMKQDDM